MSGTSLDGIDVAVADFDAGQWRLIDTAYRPFPPDLREQLLALCGQASIDVDLLGRTDAELARLYAEAALGVLEKTGLSPRDIAAIGCHGQTIRHRPPQAGSRLLQPIPYTLQIGDPNRIAELTGITTVADFRRRDIAAGGQGAPLVPAFHAHALSSVTEHRAILNIGGIANLTLLSVGSAVTGFDTGPGNTLLDLWTRLHFQQPCDRGGELAANGEPDRTLLSRLLADPYFQLAPPKSTGPEYFNLDWLRNHLPSSQVDTLDILATLTHLTAHSIAAALRRFAPQTERVLVCGGGVHNNFLMKLLAELLPPCRIGSTQEEGLNPDFVEATAFAWLAKQTMECKPGNLPGVTGAYKPVILGGIYYA
jgi:anhydro-N-acetylmuramic acid kinase